MLASPLNHWIERHPMVSFYTLAFVFSRSGMVPMVAFSWGIFPFQSPLFGLLGAGGPTFAALMVALFLITGLTWLGVIIILALFGPARLSRTQTA